MNPLAFTANQTAGVKILYSQEDNSVNFVFPNGQEARYVRRSNDYFIVYISSHNGCNRACRMCHLTQTKQTEFDQASIEDMVYQAAVVLEHYRKVVAEGQQLPAKKVHFNWMARGEPLMNTNITHYWDELSSRLALMADALTSIKEISFKISTTLPGFYPEGKDAIARVNNWPRVSLAYSLALYEMATSHFKPEIYYSLYSEFNINKLHVTKG